MGCRDLYSVHTPCLTVYWNVNYSLFIDWRLFKKMLWIEASLVVHQDDKFAGEPLSNLLFSFTSFADAHLETNRNCLSRIRVVVSPYRVIFDILETSELFTPGLYLKFILLVYLVMKRRAIVNIFFFFVFKQANLSACASFSFQRSTFPYDSFVCCFPVYVRELELTILWCFYRHSRIVILSERSTHI